MNCNNYSEVIALCKDGTNTCQIDCNFGLGSQIPIVVITLVGILFLYIIIKFKQRRDQCRTSSPNIKQE
jgi:hypothetical protein